MSFRKFVRELKVLNTEPEIIAKINESYPNIDITSPARKLEAILIDNIKGTPERNINEMLKVVNIILPIIATDSTIQTIFVNIRKAIKARFNDDANPTVKASYKVMRFDQEKWHANRVRYAEKVVSENRNKRIIPLSKVIEVMELVKDSIGPVDLAIGLQLSIGSRISEILSVSNFEEAKNENEVVQTNILKQRGNDIRTHITKPVIHYTRAHFFTMLTKLRHSLNARHYNHSHTDLSEKYNHQINNRIRSLFNLDITSHDLRRIYANLSYNIFADKTRISEAAWISDILGHERTSMNTAASYSTISIVDQPIIESNDIPRNTKSRDGHTLFRLLKTVEALEKNNMSVSARILKSYGYGSLIVDKYMKTRGQE